MPRTPYAEAFGLANLDRPGVVIRSHRLAAGLTIGSFADAVGVSRETVHRWERGPDLPKPHLARRVADVLALDLEDWAAMLDEAAQSRWPGGPLAGSGAA